MHVRIAWEIYHHQAKQNPDKASSVKPPEQMLRPPTHMYPPPPSVRPHEIAPSPGFPSGVPGMPGRSPFDTSPLGASFLGAPSSHLGKIYIFFVFIFYAIINVHLNYFSRFTFRKIRVTLWSITFCWPVTISPRPAHWNTIA